MLIQYLKFVLNGGVLGLVAVLLHALLYRAMGGGSSAVYAVASMLTYIPLIVMNFLIQRRIIFANEGRFWKFIIANSIIMLFVSLISPLCRDAISAIFGAAIGNNTGFIAAALIGATPSFFLARLWVFGGRKQNEVPL